MINIRDRKRKSERLTTEEIKAFKRYAYSFPTLIDAAFAIGVHRNTLDLVLIKGSGSPETIEKIRAKLSEPERA